MKALLRTAMVLAIAAVTLTLQASCARSVASEADSDPLLSSQDPNPTPLTVCVATECPAPWATCPGGGLCTTNTSRDIEHCGSCGRACPDLQRSLHATAVCANSKCTLACDELSADCNHDDRDGCEVFTGNDPKNCGGCGKVCKAGELCWKGACGCPSGFAECDGECRNLAADNFACGACGSVCVAPKSDDPEWKCGAAVQPPNTDWGCAGGACKLTCKASFGNCDDDLCSNGCETDERTDRLNCGACGHACDANQECVKGTCVCPSGTIRCNDRCVDPNVDVNNCGACGNGCPGAQDDSANGTPICSGGKCDYLCFAGFADCNHRINDGCEVNIGTDALHCGSCSTKCDAARSQPCVLGQCLTKPCEPGPGTF